MSKIHYTVKKNIHAWTPGEFHVLKHVEGDGAPSIVAQCDEAEAVIMAEALNAKSKPVTLVISVGDCRDLIEVIRKTTVTGFRSAATVFLDFPLNRRPAEETDAIHFHRATVNGTPLPLI